MEKLDTLIAIEAGILPHDVADGFNGAGDVGQDLIFLLS